MRVMLKTQPVIKKPPPPETFEAVQVMPDALPKGVQVREVVNADTGQKVSKPTMTANGKEVDFEFGTWIITTSTGEQRLVHPSVFEQQYAVKG